MNKFKVYSTQKLPIPVNINKHMLSQPIHKQLHSKQPRFRSTYEQVYDQFVKLTELITRRGNTRWN